MSGRFFCNSSSYDTLANKEVSLIDIRILSLKVLLFELIFLCVIRL
jgi:hypothetical protein